METPLPAVIVAWAERVGQALYACARETPNTTLAELAPRVLAVMRLHTAAALQAAIVVNQVTLDPARAPRRVSCPRCGGTSRRHRWQARQLHTVCGDTTYTRPWYVCRAAACRHGFSPTDATLGVAPYQQVSDDLRDWVSELGAELDFRAAADWLARLANVHLSPETVRQVTQQVGTELEAQHQARIATLAAPRSAATVSSADPAPGQLVVETDGVFVRYRLPGGSVWQEMKLGVVGGWCGRAGRLIAASYVAAQEPVAVFGERLAAEAGRRGAFDVRDWTGTRTAPGLATLRPVLVLGDGATWIWNLAAERFAERTEVVDYWHACQHLSAIAAARFGEGTDAARRWAATQRERLRTEGIAVVRQTLATLEAPTAEGATVLRQERAYFRTHQARMTYPAFQAQGWPIGSGAVEGAAKHLIQLRLKRPGCRWSVAGAHAVAQVRCHTLPTLLAA